MFVQLVDDLVWMNAATSHNSNFFSHKTNYIILLVRTGIFWHVPLERQG
jgi:hypothetical protein